MRLYELRQKEVINCCDGKKLGYICDIEFNVCSGKICYFAVPISCKVCGIIGKGEEIIIPYNCVKTIGKDVVVVDIEPKCKKH